MGFLGTTRELLDMAACCCVMDTLRLDTVVKKFIWNEPPPPQGVASDSGVLELLLTQMKSHGPALEAMTKKLAPT